MSGSISTQITALQTSVTTLETNLTALSTQVAKAKALLDQLASAPSTDPQTAAALQAITASLTADASSVAVDTSTLAAAVSNDTPGAPPTSGAETAAKA